MTRYTYALAVAALSLCMASNTHAHGFAGNRFFPGTIAVEDPAVADELALPAASFQDDEAEYEIEWGKRITPNFGVSIGGAWVDGEDAQGWSNLSTGLKYQFLTSAETETILAAGVEVEWGGTGDADIAEDTTTISPTFYFGHGFGDAPEWARPFAVTGAIGYVVPTEAHDEGGDPIPTVLEYGFTLQYSLPYLAAHVRDHGFPDWVNQLTPLVEVTLEQPVRNGGGEGVTGTVNPGVLWTGRHIQLGAEAMIPINDESGDDVGFALQLHVFLDDLFPHSLGRPIFGAR
ncbi:MAG: hypothetical protein R3C31_01105 [Hyphomonadaceae bacterium]